MTSMTHNNPTSPILSDESANGPCPEWCRVDHSGATWVGAETHIGDQGQVSLSLGGTHQLTDGTWRADYLSAYPQKNHGCEPVVFLENSEDGVASMTPREARILAGEILAAASTLDGRPNAAIDVDWAEEVAARLGVSVTDLIAALSWNGEEDHAMTAELANDRISVSVHDAAALTSFSEYEIRQAANRGELRYHRVGKRVAFLVEDLRAWVASLPS